jgi:hypothetical protein
MSNDDSLEEVVLVHNTDRAATVALKQVAGAGLEQLIRTATSVVYVTITFLLRIEAQLLPPLSRLPLPKVMLLSR